MNTGDHNHRIKPTKQQPGQPARVFNERAQDKGDTVAQRAPCRADNQQRDKAGDHHGQERRQNQIQRVRDRAAQIFLDDAHKPDGQQHREHRALIANHGDLKPEEVHGVEAGRHAPGVGQRRVRQDPAQRGPQVGVAAKFACGGEANQDRQDDKRRRAAHVQHDVERVVRVNPAVGFHHPEQPHQQTRGNNRRDNRHKNIGEQTRDALERVELARCDICRFRLAGFTDTRRLNKRRVNLVDHARAKNDLHLPGVTKTAFYTLDLADSLLIGKRVIDQHQTKTRCAVGGAGDVFLATEQRNKLAGDLIKIHRYLCLTSFL